MEVEGSVHGWIGFSRVSEKYVGVPSSCSGFSTIKFNHFPQQTALMKKLIWSLEEDETRHGPLSIKVDKCFICFVCTQPGS